MSLDLTVHSQTPIRHRGTGVFFREDGRTRELRTMEEVRQHFPDADLSDIHVNEYEDDELIHINLTHNLTEMASHVPISQTDGVKALPFDWKKPEEQEPLPPLSAYYLLWHPECNPLLERKTVRRHDGADGDDTAGEDVEYEVTALTPEYVRQLMAVHHYIANHREELSKYNPDNGWGSYDQLLQRTRELLYALLDIPVDDYPQYFINCWT